jgi:WD40 repeat protein
MGTTRLRHLQGLHVYSVAFSPDGRIIAATGEGRPSGRLWSSATGKLLRNLGGPDSHLGNGLSFSPDGALLAGGCWDRAGNNLFIWDVATGKRLRTFAGHPGIPIATAFLNGNKALVSVGSEGKVRWWDVATGKRSREWGPTAKGKFGQIEAVLNAALSPAGRFLVASVREQRSVQGETVRQEAVVVWDLEAGKERWRVEDERDWRSFVALSPDGKRVALNLRTKGPAVYDLASGKALQRFALPAEAPWGKESAEEVYDMAFAPDGKAVAVVTRGFGVRLWDIKTGKPGRTFCPPMATTQLRPVEWLRVRLSADGNRLLMTWGEQIWLWDVRSGLEVLELKVRIDKVDRVRFSEDGKQLLSSWQYLGECARWDVKTARLLERLEAPPSSNTPVPFSPDLRLCVRRDKEGHLFVCERATGKRLCKLDGRSNGVFRFGETFSPNNRLLVMPNYRADRLHRSLFDVATGKCLGDMPELVTHCPFAFAPNNRAVAGYTDDGSIVVADDTCKVRWRFPSPAEGRNCTGDPHALAFSPDSRYLASSHIAHGDVRIWDLSTGREHRRLAVKGARQFSSSFPSRTPRMAERWQWPGGPGSTRYNSGRSPPASCVERCAAMAPASTRWPALPTGGRWHRPAPMGRSWFGIAGAWKGPCRNGQPPCGPT